MTDAVASEAVAEQVDTRLAAGELVVVPVGDAEEIEEKTEAAPRASTDSEVVSLGVLLAVVAVVALAATAVMVALSVGAGGRL